MRMVDPFREDECLANARTASRSLTPEEDTVDDPDEDDGVDELMPADLWF